MEMFTDKDTTTDILSRLPAETLMTFKCTAKRLYNFVSDPLFLRVHYERQKGTPGLILRKRNSDKVDLLTLTESGYEIKNNVLDFLPEKVYVISSSNGILCCQSLLCQDERDRIYICNPVTRQWLQLRSKGGFFFGFAMFPFRSSSGAVSMFKLVNVKHSKSDTYSFYIYSSDTNKWKKSKEMCNLGSRICLKYTVIFTNGWLNWLTEKGDILSFHVEKEMSKVISLPSDLSLNFWCCLGESKSNLHCVYHNMSGILTVWVLKNYEDPTWEVKHSLDAAELCQQHASVIQFRYYMWIPVAFSDDVVYIKVVNERFQEAVISYDFRTKNCVIARGFPTIFSHCVSLVPLPESVKVRRSERIRKRKLQEE